MRIHPTKFVRPSCRWQHVVLPVALLVVLLGCRSREIDCEGPYCAEVERVVPLIEQSVGLPFRRPPRVEERSREQVREFVLAQLREPRVVRELTGMEAAYKRFGLLPDTLRLREFMVRLLEEQIVGYYDPQTKVLYVVEGSPRDIAHITLTHELVHALQDQYVDLRGIQQMEGDNDRQAAAHAVLEGQAVFEQLAVMLGGGNVAVNLPGGWDRVRQQIRENQASMPIFAGAPLIIQETLLFPYLSGAEFVRNFKARRAGESPLDDMPVSTKQVMHPAAYFGERDNPTRVRLAVRGQIVYENTLGAFETRILLYDYLRDHSAAVRGALGWSGDRYALVRTGAGEALAWVSVWDSPLEAAVFRDLLEQGLRRRHGVAGTGEATLRTFSVAGRTIQLSSAESGGRPLVVLVDVPEGVSPALVDVAGIRLGEVTQ